MSFTCQEISIPEILERLKNEKILAIDTETNGTHPLIHNVIMLQLGTTNGDQYVIDCRDFDIRLFKPLLENPNIVFVGHNIKFDYNMLKQYDIVLQKVYDTMIADQVLYNGQYTTLEIIKTKRFSLQGVYRHYFKTKIEKDVRDEFVGVRDRPFTDRQILYGANDVVYPLRIKEEQDALASMYEQHRWIQLENKVVLSLADMEYNGFLIDINKWKDVLQQYATDVQKTLIDLDECLLEQFKGQKYRIQGTQLSLFDNARTERLTSVNWKSATQVLSILKEVYGISPTDKHGKDSSGKGALEILDPYRNIKIVKLLLRHRQEEKILNSFGQKYIDKYIDHDGRIRTNFNSIVATGRISSRNPNIQQIPRSNQHRSCFVAPEGYLLSSSDYNSQESRIMADFAEDESMIDFFKGKGDLHSFVATKVFSTKFKKEFNVSKTENSEYRQLGKILNFSISFGASAYSIAITNSITETEAQELIDLFYLSFPKLKPLFENAKKFGLENGYIITNQYIGARRWFPEWREYKRLQAKRNLSKEDRSLLMKLQGKIERRSMNSIIQGSAGMMTKIAIVLMRNRLLEEGIRPLANASVKLTSVIHDETVMEIRKDLVEKFSTIQKDCMEKAGEYICSKVKMVATPEVHMYWTH